MSTKIKSSGDWLYNHVNIVNTTEQLGYMYFNTI